MYAILLLVGVIFTALIYWKVITPHKYWTKKGVKQGHQTILLGDSKGTFLKQQSFAELVEYVYNKFPNERFSGMYQLLRPTLVIRDPELIKQITVKEFDHFTDHMSFIPDGYEPLWTRNLFALKGDTWREMRATLSPAFTSSKMRAMFCLMSECAEQFTNYFIQNKSENAIELKDIFTRCANDIIATCAFGVKCDSLKERDNEFYVMGKEATDFSGFWKTLRFIIFITIPKLCVKLGLTFFSKSVTEFFKTLVKDTVKMRKEQNIVRPDMINLMMEARKGQLLYEAKQSDTKETGFATVEESDVGMITRRHKEEITDIDMTAQALIFFFAGFDSVATLMSFMAYEIAVNLGIQERLYQEICATLQADNGKITYEGINKMKYLDMIVTETLRKWPAAVAADRVCIDSFTIKAEHTGEVDVHLTKGDVIWIPIMGLHHDPKYFPNPDKFDPERFSEENKANIVPYSYVPFGVGPRNCIGSRFALLEVKTVIVHILAKMEFVVTDKTQIPLRLSKNGFNVNAENGFWIKLEARS